MHVSKQRRDRIASPSHFAHDFLLTPASRLIVVQCATSSSVLRSLGTRGQNSPPDFMNTRDGRRVGRTQANNAFAVKPSIPRSSRAVTTATPVAKQLIATLNISGVVSSPDATIPSIGVSSPLLNSLFMVWLFSLPSLMRLDGDKPSTF
jgi:hypothetical protein